MTKVIGVRFRTAGKIYFFDPLNFEIKRGDHVIVETARGIEFGTVMTGVTEVEDEKVIQPLKPVLRLATERDMEQEANNKLKEKEAFRICLEKIHARELEMKLIDAEYTFDNNKVLFYFTADGRIDFRELVKDLAAVFKTRIELRQIGVRDETKIVGGIGICGRPLCCHSYLSDFIPVSIKMAKEQNLSLNPTKISGVCGRLMCCLKNEEETYEELNRRLPGIGDFVTTDDGLKGEVQSVNVLRQLVKVVVEEGDEKEIKEYPVERLQFRKRHGKKEKMSLSREELEELEKLEEEEKQEIQEAAVKQGNAGQENRRRNPQENEQRRERRSSQESELHYERRSSQESEQRHENRASQASEQYKENGAVREAEQQGNNAPQGNEQRREARGHQGERRRDNRHSQGGEQRRENRGAQGGEHRRDNRGRLHEEIAKENSREAGRENAGFQEREQRRERQDNRNQRYRHNRRGDGKPKQEGQAGQYAEQPKEQ